MPPTANLARAHKFPIPASASVIESRDRAILVRYDGEQTRRGPVVYAVVASSDLVKLREGTLNRLEETLRAGGGEPGSCFHVQSATDVSLYVDTDVHQGFIDKLVSLAAHEGLEVLSARGDIRHMTGASGDIEPPAVPAYVANGFPRVDARVALDRMAELRAERDGPAPEEEPEDAGPSASF